MGKPPAHPLAERFLGTLDRELDEFAALFRGYGAPSLTTHDLCHAQFACEILLEGFAHAFGRFGYLPSVRTMHRMYREGTRNPGPAPACHGTWHPLAVGTAIEARPGSIRGPDAFCPLWKNAIYRKYGLKRRENHEVRMTFAEEIESLTRPLGLTLPARTPDWARLPEDAWIAG